MCLGWSLFLWVQRICRLIGLSKDDNDNDNNNSSSDTNYSYHHHHHRRLTCLLPTTPRKLQDMDITFSGWPFQTPQRQGMEQFGKIAWKPLTAGNTRLDSNTRTHYSHLSEPDSDAIFLCMSLRLNRYVIDICKCICIYTGNQKTCWSTSIHFLENLDHLWSFLSLLIWKHEEILTFMAVFIGETAPMLKKSRDVANIPNWLQLIMFFR